MKNVLREKRMELYPNLSAREFCERCGLKYSAYITGWEGGRSAYYTDANYGMAVKLCKVLDITIEELKEAISNNHKAKKEGKMETLINQPQYKKGSSNDNCLVQWRLKEGLTQVEVSEVLGLSHSTYGQWENGKYKPDSKNLKKLMDLTGLSMHQIASVYRDEASADVETDVTPIEEPKHEPLTFSDEEVITERDENGTAVAGRYPWTLTEEEVDMYDDIYNTMENPDKVEALNEPHDFRDEVIDEVLEKMYGLMDYKKYVYLVGMLGR